MSGNIPTDHGDDRLLQSAGHRWIRLAAVLGAIFVIAHLITIAVTCTVEGFNWGVTAWFLDITGFLAAVFFAFQCWLSSNRDASEFRSGNLWIAVWATATILARAVDTLMLFGLVKWNAVYITPTGSVLWSNVISEVFIGTAFAVTAFVGSVKLLPFASRPPRQQHESIDSNKPSVD